MNLKVANLVAVQFGMFLGILSWLAYSQLPFGESRTAAERRKPTAEPAPTFASANPGDQRSQTVDYHPGQEPAQPVAEKPVLVMQHEYSAAAVQQNSALAAQLYYQQIAPRRYAGAAVAPIYTEPAPEPPAVQADEPVPENVAYVQPTQVVVYEQPQFVAFSNSRRFANRCRSTLPVNGTPLLNAHRRLDRGQSHRGGVRHSTSLSAGSFRPAKSFGVVHHRNDSAPSRRPNQGFAARGRR